MKFGRLIKRTTVLLAGVAAAWILTAGVSSAEVTVDNGIPVVYVTVTGSKDDIDAMNQSPDHSVRCGGTVSIDVPEGFHYSDMPEASCEDLPERAMEIKGRGNTSWYAEKKPYKLKLDKKANLFGLGNNKHWVLLANAYDRTLVKDRMTAWLGDEIGMQYTPRGVPVDLVMRSSDGTYDKYLGSYYLSEQVRVGENRIEIDELEEDDVDEEIITGGYLVQNGSQVDEASPSFFETKSSEVWANHTPNFDPEDDGYVNDKQMAYIRGYMQDIEDAIHSADYSGTDGPSYRDLMDLESAAKYWLVDQACMNGDGYGTGSTYLYKPRGDKMYWGPLWDYDYAWYYDYEYEGFRIEHDWVKGMFYDTGEGGFVREVKAQWPTVRTALLKLAEDGGVIDQYFEETKRSQAADLELYPPKTYEEEDDPVFEPEKAKEKLKKWIRNRVAWIDGHLDDLDNYVHLVKAECDGVVTDRQFIEDGYPYYWRIKPAEKEGYIWTGWEDENGESISEDAKCHGDITIRAVYIREEDATKQTEIYFRNSEDYADLSSAEYPIMYTVLPEDAQDKRITWASSDDEIATIAEGSEGMATLHKTGDVVFTATLSSGVSKSFTLHIVDYRRPCPESINTDQEIYELPAGSYGHIEVTPDPVDAYVMGSSMESEDESIAAVDDNGVITALKPGRTKVSILLYSESEDGLIELEKTVEIVVKEEKPGEIAYHCIDGGDQTWRKGSGVYAKFIFKRNANDNETIDHFTGIMIDGESLGETDYTAKAGSVVIRVSPDYLESLSLGKHTLTASFDDGDDADAAFTVVSASGGSSDDGSGDSSSSGNSTSNKSGTSTTGKSAVKSGTGSSAKKATSSKTGDSGTVMLWVMLMLIAAVVIVRKIVKGRGHSISL